MTDYYGRTGAINSDGTPLFASDHDKVNESEVAKLINLRWSCELREFGNLSPVDFYALRDGRLVGVLEVKSRRMPSTKYDTVFLNVRKWLSLQLAGAGLGCPALFVVKFDDKTKWINVQDVDASKVRVGGCNRVVKSKSDIEPVIYVPISAMHDLDAEKPQRDNNAERQP